MNDLNEFDAEHILISSDCLLEKIQHFIDTHVSGITFNQNDDNTCLLLIDDLKKCLDVLESMHLTYQTRLQNTDTQVQGINGYAQTLSLTSSTVKGDLSYVK